MREFAETCERIAATTKKLEKTAIVAEYLKSRPVDDAAIAAVFLSGRPFPVWEETTLQVGGRLLWSLVAELAGKDGSELTAQYRKLGDLGAVAAAVLPERAESQLSVADVEQAFRQIAEARGSAAKTALARDLLAKASPLEAKYIVKIMTGDLRIGLKESLVEEAIAKSYGATLAEVQRANMLLGDIAGTVRFVAGGRLGEARMRLFHPLGFMLASPVESPEEGLSYFAEAAVEDKYDGIRAQAHVSSDEVKLFSRTRDEITESFPELPLAFAGLPHDAILDGEIVAWEYPDREREREEDTRKVVDEAVSQDAEEKDAEEKATEERAAEEEARQLGSARPFSVLQQRLGRKKVTEKMLREVPVAFLAFDVLYADGELLIERPLAERARILDQMLAGKSSPHRSREAQSKGQAKLLFEHKDQLPSARVIRAPVFRAAAPEAVEELFAAARARGNEGLMIKDLTSPYTPGKRGKSWLKMKRELATLDVVVTAAEFGHGKRISVLSDYTFAVWNANKDRLENIGKAYSGLTDVEIAEMTKWFLEHTIEDQGFRRIVEPKIVLEVAFNNMMRSERHESGFALRFPRIVRLRPDKLPEDADTIDRAEEIWASQSK